MSRTDADRDLQALVGIQGVEARSLATDYRDAWMDGRVLADRVAAYAWIRANGTRVRRELLVSFEPNAPLPHPTEIAAWVVEHSDGAQLKGVRNRDPWLRIEVRDEHGELTDTLDLDAESGTAIGELFSAAQTLEVRYRWPQLDAIMFILTGELPTQRLIETSASQETRLGAAVDSTFASVPMAQEIVLRCRPQATQDQVREAYEAQRRRALSLEMWDTAPGKRNRATSSPRTRDLAILAARILSGVFESTAHARETYVSEHAGEELTYPSTPEGVSRFRRDTRAAWRRITGRDFTFSDAFSSSMGVEVGPLR